MPITGFLYFGSFHCVSSASVLLLAFDLSFMFKAFLLCPATPGCLLLLQGEVPKSRGTARWLHGQTCPPVGSSLSVRGPSNNSISGTFLLGRSVSPEGKPLISWGNLVMAGAFHAQTLWPGASLSLLTCHHLAVWEGRRPGDFPPICTFSDVFHTPSAEAPGASGSWAFNSAQFL